MPHVLNDRPLMERNDTRVFDLMQFSPIAKNGWVLLGDTSRYVGATAKRFESVCATATGISVVVSGIENILTAHFVTLDENAKFIKNSFRYKMGSWKSNGKTVDKSWTITRPMSNNHWKIVEHV